jgi:hypothetical protein
VRAALAVAGVALAGGCLGVPAAGDRADGGGDGDGGRDEPVDAAAGCVVELGFDVPPERGFETVDDGGVAMDFPGSLSLDAVEVGRGFVRSLDAYPFASRRLSIAVIDAAVPDSVFAGIGVETARGEGVRFGVRGGQLVLEVCDPIGECDDSASTTFAGPGWIALHQLAGDAEIKAEASGDGVEWDEVATRAIGAGIARRIYAGMWVEAGSTGSAGLDDLRLCDASP